MIDLNPIHACGFEALPKLWMPQSIGIYGCTSGFALIICLAAALALFLTLLRFRPASLLKTIAATAVIAGAGVLIYLGALQGDLGWQLIGLALAAAPFSYLVVARSRDHAPRQMLGKVLASAGAILIVGGAAFALLDEATRSDQVTKLWVEYRLRHGSDIQGMVVSCPEPKDEDFTCGGALPKSKTPDVIFYVRIWPSDPYKFTWEYKHEIVTLKLLQKGLSEDGRLKIACPHITQGGDRFLCTGIDKSGVQKLVAIIDPNTDNHDDFDAETYWSSVDPAVVNDALEENIGIAGMDKALADPPQGLVKPHKPIVDGDIEFTLDSFIVRDVLQGYDSPIYPDVPGDVFARAEIHFKNLSKRLVDPFCAGTAIFLVDTNNNLYLESQSIELPSSHVCSANVPKGKERTDRVSFDIPPTAVPYKVVLYDPFDPKDFDGISAIHVDIRAITDRKLTNPINTANDAVHLCATKFAYYFDSSSSARQTCSYWQGNGVLTTEGLYDEAASDKAGLVDPMKEDGTVNPNRLPILG